MNFTGAWTKTKIIFFARTKFLTNAIRILDHIKILYAMDWERVSGWTLEKMSTNDETTSVYAKCAEENVHENGNWMCRHSSYFNSAKSNINQMVEI